jgi:hypothetical protein
MYCRKSLKGDDLPSRPQTNAVTSGHLSYSIAAMPWRGGADSRAALFTRWRKCSKTHWPELSLPTANSLEHHFFSSGCLADGLISAASSTQIRHRLTKPCDGAHVRIEEGRPRLGARATSPLSSSGPSANGAALVCRLSRPSTFLRILLQQAALRVSKIVRLLDVPCRTIEQMRLVNALCAVEEHVRGCAR